MLQPSHLLLLWLPFLVACPANEGGFIFTLTKLDIPGSRKPVTGTDQPLLPCGGQKAGNRPSLQTGEFDLRFTFLQRKPVKVSSANLRHSYDLICWRTIKKGTKADFLIRRPGGDKVTDKVTVVVEALRDEKLAYVGRREGMTIDHDQQASIFMRPTILETSIYVSKEVELQKKGETGPKDSLGFSCLDSPRHPRAFHSATLLPNGEVLIYGGIAGQSGDVIAGSQAVALTTAEIFRPNYGESGNTDSNFSVVATNLPPRAFHHAALLPSPAEGPFKILVVGGLEPNQAGGQTDPVVQVGMPQAPFMFTPYKGATAGAALLLTYYPKEAKVTSDDLVALPRAMFPAVAQRGALLAVAGGGQVWNDSTKGFVDAKYLQLIDLTETPTARPQALTMVNQRVKHAVAILDTDSYVVVGGHMDGNDADQGEYLPAGATALANVQFDPTDLNMSSIAHTLTPIGTTDLDIKDGINPPRDALWAGGFPLGTLAPAALVRETGPRPQPRPQGQALYTVKSGTPPIATKQPTTDTAGARLPNHFQTVGHHDAIQMYDGGVLLSGGKLGQELQNCQVESPFCASNQIVIYDSNVTPKPPTTKDASWRLFVPRMGHRMTRLLDNTVLITGGISLKKSTAEGQVLATPELFNPRTGAPAEDLFTRDPSNVCEDRDPAEESAN